MALLIKKKNGIFLSKFVFGYKKKKVSMAPKFDGGGSKALGAGPLKRQFFAASLRPVFYIMNGKWECSVFLCI